MGPLFIPVKGHKELLREWPYALKWRCVRARSSCTRLRVYKNWLLSKIWLVLVCPTARVVALLCTGVHTYSFPPFGYCDFVLFALRGSGAGGETDSGDTAGGAAAGQSTGRVAHQLGCPAAVSMAVSLCLPRPAGGGAAQHCSRGECRLYSTKVETRL